MKKKGIRILSTVIAGIVTATSVPWGMTGVFAETANGSRNVRIWRERYSSRGRTTVGRI